MTWTLLRWLSATLLLASGGARAQAATVYAETAPYSEYQVKAVALWNFAQFVEWPATAFPDANAPVVIGVLGKDPFEKTLDEAVRGVTINSRKIVIHRAKLLEELGKCHLVFICQSEQSRLAPILAALQRGPVLTISELDQFARRGGIINLTVQEKNMRLEINVENAERQGLKISSKLLKLSKVVGGKEGG